MTLFRAPLNSIIIACVIVAFGSASAQVSCPDGYLTIEGACFHFSGGEQLVYSDAENYCANLGGGQLAVLDDCSLFGAVVNYIEADAERDGYSYWVGATDIEEEGTWVWVNGESVAMGSPFWGETDGVRQPNGDDRINCAFLEHWNRHQMSNAGCMSVLSAICRVDPVQG